jgi:type I restriction enzyme S subunit
MPRSDWSVVSKTQFAVPSGFVEQEKIGATFKTLDRLITLHQREYDKTVNIKKAMLEKMFPKDGADKPEIRFAGFTDSWEQRKLGELGCVAMNRRIFKWQTTESGDVPFYKIGTFGGEPDAFISRKLFEEYKTKYPYPEVGDILISAAGSIGRTVEYTGRDEYFQDSNIVWLKQEKRLDNSFLKQFYSMVKWQGLEGSTIKRLYNKTILDTPISVPSIDEQAKIGAFFSNLDRLITLHRRELEKLQNMKKALLEKMFV